MEAPEVILDVAPSRAAGDAALPRVVQGGEDHPDGQLGIRGHVIPDRDVRTAAQRPPRE